MKYAALHPREFRTYTAVCRSLLALARSPSLRRSAIALLGPRPALLERILAAALG